MEFARQFVKDNNGRLLASRAYLAPRGWKSADVIDRAKQKLIKAGFIVEMVKGHRPNTASWFAVTAGDLLTESDFYRFEHRLIFGAIGALINANRPADVITVFDRLQRADKGEDCGGLVYLNALAQSVPSAANMRRYAEIVRERAVQRAVIATATATEATALAWEGDDAGATIDRITTLFGALQRGQVRKVPRSIAEIALERVDHYAALENGTETAGWPTHIPALDSRLNGGLRAGGLYILAARPSVGKSSFAESLGLGLAGGGLPTLFLSMEMGEAEVADRGVTSAGRVSYSALLTGKMDSEHWERATEAMERLAQLPFFVDCQGVLPLAQIRLYSLARTRLYASADPKPLLRR